MNMLRHTLIVFAAVMLASCGIYTNYERPAQAVADMDSLYRPEARPDTTRSIAMLRWEELFTDTCLQQLIRQGLAANADLAVAPLQVEETQATLRQSKLAYLPSVQLEPTGTLSSFDGQKTQKTYSVGASASWEIDLFGKLRNSKRQALASLLASDAYRQAMQTQVVATVADSYYALLMLDEQIRITEQTAESWREYVRSLAALMQAGQAGRATPAQAAARPCHTGTGRGLAAGCRIIAAQPSAAGHRAGECPLRLCRSDTPAPGTRYDGRTALSFPP